jgi:quercetin dioxygenase-like cupin family protein
MNEQSTTTRPYRLGKDEGVNDLWWPYGPAVGRYTVKAGGEQSDGRIVQMLARDHHGAATPLHVHTDVDETFYVISGSVEAVVGEERFEANAGDFVFAPKGVPHAWIVTSEDAELLITTAGAGTLDAEGHGMLGFFREVATPVLEGEAQPEPAMPDQELFARRMSAYGIELLGPPPFAA